MSQLPGAAVLPLGSPSLLSVRHSGHTAGFARKGRSVPDNGLARKLRGGSPGLMVGMQFSRSRDVGLLRFRSPGVAMAASTSSVGGNWVEEPGSRRGSSSSNEFQLQLARFVNWAKQKVEFHPELMALAFVAFVLGELWVYGFTVLRFVILGVSLLHFTRTVASSGLLHGDAQRLLRERAGKQLQKFAGLWQAGTTSTISSEASSSEVEKSQPERKTVVNIKLKGKRISDTRQDWNSGSKESFVDEEGDGQRDSNPDSPRLVRLASTISTIVNSAGVNSANKVGSGIQSIHRDFYREDFATGVETDEIESHGGDADSRESSVEGNELYRSRVEIQPEPESSGLMETETQFQRGQWKAGDNPQHQGNEQILGPDFASFWGPTNLETEEPVDDGARVLAATGSSEADERDSSTGISSARNADIDLQVEKGVSTAAPWQNDDSGEAREEGWTYKYYDEVVYKSAPIIGGSTSPDAGKSKEWDENNGGRLYFSAVGDSRRKIGGGYVGATEHRGSLTKSRAMGRGSNAGSVDDWDQDWDQERAKGRGRRTSSDEENQYLQHDLGRGSGGNYFGGKEQTWTGGDESGDAATTAYGIGRASSGRSQQMGDAAEFGGKQERNLNRDWDMDNRNLRGGVSSSAMDSSGTDEDLFSRETRMRYNLSRDFSSMAQDVRRGGDGEDMETGDSAWRGKRRMGEGTSRSSNRSEDDTPNQSRRDYSPEDMDPQMRSRGDPSSSSSRELEEQQNMALERLKQSDSVQIERYLDEAEALLEEGTQGLEGRIEVGVAESMLYDAAKLFERASDMDPTDLTAIGQWGNTLLVHGEMKLKVSQQIRAMLPASKPSGLPFRGGGRDSADDREREEMELALQQVCEECEELLVEAGRKYRRALSLDRTDVRALYNWGLALCYRGQLISEEGGEAAILDADKVYLAATDKFEAMLGISQDYAAGALLNWGLALRDRSRLRPMGDKERVQILLQAKELFQDALGLDPNYGQARGAVAACLTELRELQSLEVQPKQDKRDGPTNWWRRGG